MKHVLMAGIAALALFTGCSKNSGTQLIPEGPPLRSGDSLRVRADFRFDPFTDRRAYACFDRNGSCEMDLFFNVYAFGDSIVELTVDTARLWGGGVDSLRVDADFRKFKDFRGDTVGGMRVEDGFLLFTEHGVEMRGIRSGSLRIRFRARLSRPGGLTDTVTLEQSFRVDRWSHSTVTGP